MSIYIKPSETIPQPSGKTNTLLPASDTTMILLNTTLNELTETLNPRKDEEYLSYQSPISQNLISQDLQRAILKMQQRGYDERTEENDETVEENEDSDNSQSTISQSSGMQAVFDLQGNICQLMQDAINSNISQSQDQVTIGNALEKTAEEQYDEIEKKIDELNKKKKQRSFWGFFKGIGNLMKDIDNLMKDVRNDVFTGDFSNLSDDVSAIKNNGAIVDIGNIGKLLWQGIVMHFDVLKELVLGDMQELKAQGKKDFSKIEENPAVSLLMQALSYLALAASLVGAAMTGGALSVAVVIIIASMAMSSSLNDDLKGGQDFAASLLNDLGIPKSVADIITQIPSFNDLANETTKLLIKMGIPEKAAKPIGDVATIIAVAGAAGLTGNIGLIFLATGTAMTSEASRLAKDLGATGVLAQIITISLEITGMALSCYGGVKLSGSASPIKNSNTILKMTQQVQIGTNITNGNLQVIQGAKTIDLGQLTSAITQLEGELSLTQTMISMNNTMMNNTSAELQSIVSEYDQMINNFGIIAASGLATAKALAQN